MEALYQYAKIARSLQLNRRPLFALVLLCFWSSLSVYNLSAATKILTANNTFFFKAKYVLLVREARTQLQNFLSRL